MLVLQPQSIWPSCSAATLSPIGPIGRVLPKLSGCREELCDDSLFRTQFILCISRLAAQMGNESVIIMFREGQQLASFKRMLDQHV